MTATTQAGRTERVDSSKIVGAIVLGVVLAVVINLVLLLVLPMLGMPLMIQMGGPGTPVVALSAIPVMVATIVPALAAGVLFWLLGRFTPRPYTIFLAVSAAFLLLSMFGPLTLPVETSTKIGLALMHIVAGAAIIWALVTRTRQ